MIQIIRSISLEEMAKVIDETVQANKSLNTTRLEWFGEFGYGDDFEGFTHPRAHQVSDVGTLRPVKDSELSKVVDGVLLDFTTEELMQKLAMDDLTDAVVKAFKDDVPDDLYIHTDRGYPVVEYGFTNAHGFDDTVSLEIHPDEDSENLEDGYYFCANVEQNAQRQFEYLDQAANSFKNSYEIIKQEEEFNSKPKSFSI